jgi:hypothetical protein
MFVHDEWPSFVDKEKLYQLVKDVLDLASEGLAKRGYGEEKMLLPLYERVEEENNPAKKMLLLRKQGVALQDIILEYGQAR